MVYRRACEISIEFFSLQLKEQNLLQGDVIDGFDRGRVTVATSMDLSKPCDCVNHNIFGGEIKLNEVSSIDNSWIQS